MKAFVIALVGVTFSVACGGGGWPHVVTQGEVPSSDGAPSVSKVTDLGDMIEMPRTGPVPRGGIDGTIVVGEYVLIEGSNFGRQPTLLIGGRPVPILARTSGGGLVAQIPAGVAAGKIPVEVSHPGGKGARDIDVHRYAFVTQDDANQVHVLDIGASEATVAGNAVAVDAPQAVRLSADGAVAYVASGRERGGETPDQGTLSVLTVAAPHGPAVGFDTNTEVPVVISLAVARAAPVLAVVGTQQLQLFLLQEKRHPSPYEAWRFPVELAAAGVVAADLTPDGKWLLVLLAEGNQLVAIDVSTPESPKVAGVLALLPGERVPLARDLALAADGATAWVVVGDTAQSVAAGKQATRVVTVALRDGGALEVVRTADVVGATAPVRILAARSGAVAAGTTIRDTAGDVALFMTTVNSALFVLGTAGADAAATLGPIAEPALLVRSDMDGKGGALFAAGQILSAMEVSPDAQLLLISGCRPTIDGGSVTLDFGVTVAPLAPGAAKPTFVKLASLPASALEPPFVIGQVGIQP